jgi:hypothetical protein
MGRDGGSGCSPEWRLLLCVDELALFDLLFLSFDWLCNPLRNKAIIGL